MGEKFAGGSDVFKGSTEVATVKMVILKGGTAVDGGKMTVGKASTAVFCGIWPYFRFPPRWTAKYGRFSCFHRGFLSKMTVRGISTVVVGKI